MYAVIATGGKQYRVEEGQRLEVELLGSPEADVELRPVLLVDGDQVFSKPDELAGSSVSARIVAETKGAKVTGFVYRPKARHRRRWGHRQQYSTIEITGITRG